MAELTKETKFPDCVFGTQSSPHFCKSEPTEGSAGASPLCPQCSSKKVWRDGHRTPMFGQPIQRWRCRECDYKFSDPVDVENARKAFQQVQNIESMKLKSTDDIAITRQICVDNKETKNLVAEQKTTIVDPQKSELDLQKLKGAIVDFIWQLQKNAYAEDTYVPYGENLEFLVKNGAALFDPESVKSVVAKLQKTDIRKWNLIKAYKCFMEYTGLKAKMPVYQVIRKLPFIPLEAEIDQVIAGCNKTMATFLLTLKETGMRAGEAYRLTWDDIDTVTRTLAVTPEKGSNARTLKISDKLLALLFAMPHVEKRIFTWKKKSYVGKSFRRMRKRIVKNTANQRLMKIHFHTLRYWKGTMEYKRTLSLLHVMAILGHRNWKNAQLYVDLASITFGTDEFVCAVEESSRSYKINRERV
jgi:integrase